MSAATHASPQPRLALSDRAREPPRWRVVAVTLGACALNGGLLAAASALREAPLSPVGLAVGIGGGVLSALLLASILEWLVHRYVMHRRWKPRLLALIYDLHHRAHHFHHFTPHRYVHEGPINYVPVLPPQPRALCQSRGSRLLSQAAQVLFYAVVGVIFVVLPSLLLTWNPVFVAALGVALVVLIALFVRVHDAVHYPGQSVVEHMPGFRWLDHHHYLHHIDVRANTNFLLPLGDVLYGTWRAAMTKDEARRFWSFEEAKARYVDPDTMPAPARGVRRGEVGEGGAR